MRNKKIIQYKEMIRRHSEVKRMQSLGIELIYKKSKIKITTGLILVSIGVVTLPFPTGSSVLIPVGLSLLVSGGIDIARYKDTLRRKLKGYWWRLCKWIGY